MTTDPKYEEEVSGCTATVAIVSKDKIFCVSLSTNVIDSFAHPHRPILEIREPFSALKVAQSHSHSITNPRTKVCAFPRVMKSSANAT